MERSEILKKFPSALPIDKLPEGAKEENISVYRVCETGKIEAASFKRKVKLVSHSFVEE